MQCFFPTYMYNPLQHVSQRKIGYVNIMDTQHAVCLQRGESGQSHLNYDAGEKGACLLSAASVPWNDFMWEEKCVTADAIQDQPGLDVTLCWINWKIQHARNLEVIWSANS